MGSYFDTMQVCLNGHMITDRYDTYPSKRQNNCNKCGSKTVISCPSCKARIRGYEHYDHVVGGSGPTVPLFCHECGEPYPWKDILQRERKKSSRKNTSYWNFINPFWLVWQLFRLIWKFKIYSLIGTIIVGLVISYLSWKFGWTK